MMNGGMPMLPQNQTPRMAVEQQQQQQQQQQLSAMPPQMPPMPMSAGPAQGGSAM